MGEIRYTVNESGDDREIRTTITAAQRGSGATGSTGCIGETSRCGHFTSDPAAEPDNPSADFTGRYECDGGEGIQPCTVQINQAGDYVYGWFQIDFYVSESGGRTVLLDAITGYFTGEVTSSGGSVQVGIEGQARIRQGRISNVSARDGRVRSMTLALSPSQFRFIRGTRAAQIHSFDLTSVSNQPRMPERALAGIRSSNPVLYQSEAHPLRSRQVRTMGRWINEILVPRINACVGHRGTSLLGPLHGMFNTISEAFRDRLFGGFFRPQQMDLVRTVFLHAIETTSMTLSGSGEQKTILEAIYLIADTGEEADQSPLFRTFRAMFGESNGQPVLPAHLGRYKYQVEVTYRQVTQGIPSTGITLGGRGAEIRMTRSVQQGTSWQQDGDPHQFDAAVGIVKIGASQAVGARRGGGGGGGSRRSPGPSVEAGLSRFEFQSYRRWTWDMFPGYFEVFEVQIQFKLPFNIISGPSYNDVAISFYGSGDVPALIAGVENSRSIDTGAQMQAEVGFGWYPGWLWTDTRAREGSAIDVSGLPSGRVRWGDRTHVCYPVDVESLSDEGRMALGTVLAENLVLMANGNSNLRLDGHTSRTGSSQHNMVLSIRRSQFALQAIVDILTDKLEIPLAATAGSGGDGTVRLFGFGEEQAVREGSQEGEERPDQRRVDLCVNGSAVARLSVSD